MTEEELKQEAEEYYEDETEGTFQICEDCYWFADAVQTAYVDSAKPREKQIQIDAEQIRALQKQNGELTDKVKKLEARCNELFLQTCEQKEQLTKAKEIISELLNSCFGYNSKTINYEVKAKAEQFLKEVEK